MRTDHDSEVTSRNACKCIFSEWQPALTNTSAMHHPYPKPSKFCSSCFHATRGWAAQTFRTLEHYNTNRTALIFPKITNVSTSSAHSSQDNKLLFKHRDGNVGIAEILPISSTHLLASTCFLHMKQQLSCCHANIPS